MSPNNKTNETPIRFAPCRRTTPLSCRAAELPLTLNCARDVHQTEACGPVSFNGLLGAIVYALFSVRLSFTGDLDNPSRFAAMAVVQRNTHIATMQAKMRLG